MKKTLFIIFAVAIVTGCTDAETYAEIERTLKKSCQEPLSAEVTVSTWNNSVSMECGKLK